MQVISVLFRSGFRQLSRYVEASFATIFSSIILLIVQFFLWKAINSDFTSMQALATYLVFSHVIACFYPSGLSGRRVGGTAFAAAAAKGFHSRFPDTQARFVAV